MEDKKTVGYKEFSRARNKAMIEMARVSMSVAGFERAVELEINSGMVDDEITIDFRVNARVGNSAETAVLMLLMAEANELMDNFKYKGYVVDYTRED